MVAGPKSLGFLRSCEAENHKKPRNRLSVAQLRQPPRIRPIPELLAFGYDARATLLNKSTLRFRAETRPINAVAPRDRMEL
jgi:hypothetical protein